MAVKSATPPSSVIDYVEYMDIQAEHEKFKQNITETTDSNAEMKPSEKDCGLVDKSMRIITKVWRSLKNLFG